ncbi:MAG: YicC family protein [Methylobacterium sp.]|nr:YicC family protein [Methylobacterium sp.]
MTGFAAAQQLTAAGTLSIELRSVNHRYLELHLRLDEVLRSFEPLVRERLAACLARGKVEARVSLLAPSGEPAGAELNPQVLQQLARLSSAVLQQFPHSRPLSVADILRWPGVLATRDVAIENLEGTLRAGLEQALADLGDARRREGEKLAAIILDRVAQMHSLIGGVKPLLPRLMQSYREKLSARLREAMQTVDQARIHEELALFAQKIDVDEELERLGAHLQEVQRVLGAGGAVGKRLDFLMQELNREANTLGSKSVSTETSQVAMSLKVLIEQMREQIQNIE